MIRRLLSIIMLCSVCVAGVYAASGRCGKNLTWKLQKGVLTISGHGDMYDLKEDHPFGNKFKTLVVEDGVTSLARGLCRECLDLRAVELPGSLRTINAYAFADCENLTEVRIPYGVEYIGERAFMNCVSFIQVEIPMSVKTIGKEAFAGCANLVKASISQSVEKIGKKAFEGCKLLSTLTELPPYVNAQTFYDYGLNRSAVNNYYTRKEEIAARFGNSSGSQQPEEPAGKQLQPSDIDLDIPLTGKSNPNTFVVIIANEHYGKLPDVPFAVNDGNTFALYCKRTLGVPEKNILHYSDASYGSMREAMSDLRLINDVVGDNMRLIFYYAGHGSPDDATLEPFLIPVDAPRVNKDVCVSLAQLYREIGEMRLKSATVFLDACFSGGSRDGGMMLADKGARGVARVPKAQALPGNMAVFSATDKEQTALPYAEKNHGMFTYHLLKRLKETGGEASLSDLRDYLSENVSRDSATVNRKEQTPTVNISAQAASTWDSWKLND